MTKATMVPSRRSVHLHEWHGSQHLWCNHRSSFLTTNRAMEPILGLHPPMHPLLHPNLSHTLLHPHRPLHHGLCNPSIPIQQLANSPSLIPRPWYLESQYLHVRLSSPLRSPLRLSMWSSHLPRVISIRMSCQSGWTIMVGFRTSMSSYLLRRTT